MTVDLELARAGDTTAFGRLYETHQPAALRFARSCARNIADADEIVSESFAQILDLMKRGKGPADDFRAYLHRTIRNEAIRRGKETARTRPTDDEWRLDRPVNHPELRAWTERTRNRRLTAALAQLSPRHQHALWLVQIEGNKPHEVCDRFGVNANAMAALVYRAKACLRVAYRQQVLADLNEQKGR